MNKHIISEKEFSWPEETSLALATRLRFVLAALQSIQAKKIGSSVVTVLKMNRKS
ncbi:MAG: hypothetical protein AB4426_07990 [Xenococcaceae cyanobacterium]